MTIATISNAADLAAAAYAPLQEGITGSQENLSTLAPLTSAFRSEAQAANLASRYPTVVARFDDARSEVGAGTGLSVVVFADGAQNLTVAFRGTDQRSGNPNDIVPTDADILSHGAGYDQIVAMVNWWLRATSLPDEAVSQYRLAEYAADKVPPGAVVLRENALQVYVAERADDVFGSGELVPSLARDPDGSIDVVGHSLGGHLAMAFATIFPEIVNRAIVFNSPGFRDTPQNREFFELLGGHIPTTEDAAIFNVIADESRVDDVPFAGVAGLWSKPGQVIGVPIEDQWLADEPHPFESFNHSSAAIADSLAVYRVLAELSPSLTTSQYKVILNQAAKGTAGGYESIIDALNPLFGIEAPPLPVGNRSRDELYKAIYRLAESDAYRAKLNWLEIRPLPESATDLLTAAELPGAGLAYRYSLVHLAPFVVLDPENTGLYARYEPGGDNEGELDSYDPVLNAKGLTDSFLEDRAAFLERKLFISGLDLTSYYEDQSPSAPPVPDPRASAYQLEARHYEDRESGFIASTGGNANSLQHFIFGTGEADTLRGAGRDDHLYGGDGSDVLIGKADDDYLEGGSGFDMYVFAPGDGADVVLDADDNGMLVRGDTALFLGLRQDENTWTFGSVTYTRAATGQDLLVSFAGSSDAITIRDFDFAAAATVGSLGLRLLDAPSVAEDPERVFFGDRADWDSDPNEEGVQTQTDEFGNVVRADGRDRPDIPEVGRADTFFGSTDADVEYFEAGAGNDVIWADGLGGAAAGVGGRDFIDAGEGADFVIAGAGADWVEGGAGADVLLGNFGDDALFADSTLDRALGIAALMAQGELGAPSAERGDLLSADEGEDIAIGSALADYLAGGAGADLLVGGAGDDILYGDQAVTGAALNWTASRSVQTSGGVKDFRVATTGLVLVEAQSGSADLLYGGAGRDWLFGGLGDDYLEGGNTPGDANVEDDVLFGEGGSDVLIGGSGRDFLSGDSVSADADGTWGNDYLSGGPGDDELLGGKGSDFLDGGADDDVLVGGDGDDVLIGGTGSDVLVGGAGRDTYIFNRGDGVDIVQDEAPGFGQANPEASILVLGEGIERADVKFRPGSLLIDLGQGDAIHFEGFFPNLPFSQPLLERIEFADGGVMTYAEMMAQGFDIDGSSENDHIEGTAVNDRIHAGAGDDFISPGFGNDVVYTEGGADTVSDVGGDDTVYARGEGERLMDDDGINALDLTAYAGLTAENLEVTQYVGADGEQYLNLHVRDDGNPGATPDGAGVSIRGGELGYYATVTVNDGQGGAVTLTHADLMTGHTAGGLVYRGRKGAAEHMVGTPYADVMDGRGGADVLAGGGGTDTYVLAPDTGADTVVEASGAASVIELAPGLTFTDLRVEQVGDDLKVGVRGTQNSLTVEGYFARSQSATIFDPLAGESVEAEALLGAAPRDREALKQDYRIAAHSMFVEERLRQGYSFLDPNTAVAQDTIAAIRSIATTVESVTTTFHWFDGQPDQVTHDTHSLVTWTDPFAGRVDTTTVRFEMPVREAESGVIVGLSGIATNSASGQVWAEMDWVRPIDQPLGTPSVTVTITFIEGPEIDPTTGDNVVVGTLTTETRRQAFTGTATGHITGVVAGDPPIVNPNELLPPYKLVGSFSQTVTTLAGEVRGGAGNNTIFGGYLVDAGAGDDTISDASGLLLGGPGNDSIHGTGALYGESGNDVLRYAADGSVSPLLAPGSDRLLDGGAGNDRLYGGGVVMKPGSGDDVLVGLRGHDVVRIGAADVGTKLLWDTETAVDEEDEDGIFVDWYYDSLGMEDWRDLPEEDLPALPSAEDYAVLAPAFGSDWYPFDRIELPSSATLATLSVSFGTVDAGAEGIPELGEAGRTLELAWGTGTFLRVVLPGEDGLIGSGFEVVTLGDGTELRLDELMALVGVLPAVPLRPLTGTWLADVLEGTSAGEFIAGFEGDDFLSGGDGNDTYAYFLGDGLDEIHDSGGDDTIQLGEGIAPTDVMLFARAGGVAVEIGGPEAGLFLSDWFSAGARIERIEFADGTAWDEAALQSRIITQIPLVGTADGDFLEGTSADEFLQGLEGDDFLVGGGGNDIFRGGPGWDDAEGGEGDDTYLYLPGDEYEGILDYGGNDVLRFGEGIAPESVLVTRDPFSLYLLVDGGRVALFDWFTDENRVETVEFADGTVWDQAVLESRIVRAPATEGDDLISGTDGDDMLDALGGDDELFGMDGNDILRGGPGDDSMYDWQGSNLFDGGEGADLIYTEGSAFIVGGAGDDWIDRVGGGAVIAFNPGDGRDFMWLPEDEFALSLGGGITGSDLSLSGSSPWTIVLSIGAGESITLQRAFDETGNLLPLPQITLQLFGSVHAYDFTGIVAEFEAARDADPALEAFPLADVLEAYHMGTSEEAALGGALAWRYATSGDLDGLGAAQIHQILGSGDFGLAPQPIHMDGGNEAPVLVLPLPDQSVVAGSPFGFSIPAGAFVDPDAGDMLVFSASLAGGAALPAWLGFDAASGAFAGTPEAQHIGAYQVQVVATDATGAAASSDFTLIVRAADGATVTGGKADDVIHGGSGDETLIAKGGNDYVFGDAGNDVLRGGNGNDVLQGGAGDDVLRSGNGQNLLDGGAGDDVIHGGQAAGFLVGGAGNDTLRVGKGTDVIAFNLGDGIDTLVGGRDGGNTISLGGGIGYADLSFSKEGRNLVLNVGQDDKLVLKNWYNGNHSVLNLQVIADAMEEFDATSGDPLYSKKVQVFDMWALVAKFDQALAANPHLDSWSLLNGLADAHVSASDDAAIGGDLAYWYGKNGSLSGLSVTAAQDLLGVPGFGADAQSLRPFTGLQEGFVRLV